MSRSVKESKCTKLLEFCETEMQCENPVFVSLILYLQKKSRGEFGKLLTQNSANVESVFREKLFNEQLFVNDGITCWNEELFSEKRFGDTAIGDTICEACPNVWNAVSPRLAAVVNEIDHESIIAEDAVYTYEYFTNHNRRGTRGAFYTEDKVAKLVFAPLFSDKLCRELRESDDSKADALERLCKWRFLDPACGCGSILISVKRTLASIMDEFSINHELMQNVTTFGFELDRNSACCAELALRILDVELGVRSNDAGYIACGNAAKDDWEEIFGIVDFIIGNPPFLGGSKLSVEQVADMKRCWGHLYKPDMDYVSCWIRLAANYVDKHPTTRVGFITTNSITQGVQLSSVWPPVLGTIRLAFAYESFRWDPTLLVNVVILGIESRKTITPYKPILYRVKEATTTDRTFEKIELQIELAPHLQANVPFVELSKRTTNISSKAPRIHSGAQVSDSLDTKGFTLTKEDVQELKKQSPTSCQYIRPQIAAKEMLSGKEIYYLDLQLAAKIPKVFAERIQHVREYRLSSQNKEAERLADRPHSWGVQTTIHNGSILVIPTNSSKNYAVLPVVLVDPYEYTLPHQYVVCNSTVYFVEDGSLFSFGVLQSSMHRAWVYALCGTNGESTRYNAQLYRTFVWPTQNPAAVARVKAAAGAIIDHRHQSKDDSDDEKGSMHDLYCGEMSRKLTRLHRTLDEAVEAAYGVAEPFENDQQRFAFLVDLYHKEVAREMGSKKRQTSLTEMFAKKPNLAKDE